MMLNLSSKLYSILAHKLLKGILPAFCAWFSNREVSHDVEFVVKVIFYFGTEIA